MDASLINGTDIL